MLRRYPVYVKDPRIERVGTVELPAALVDAYPQICVAVRSRKLFGLRGDGAPDTLVLTRCHVRFDHKLPMHPDGGLRFGTTTERGLVVELGRDLDMLYRLDEFTPEITREQLRERLATLH